MNERIRQLAEQAFNKANDGTIADIKIPKEFIDEFAQLIVQECIEVVEQQKAKMSYGPTFVIEDIKQHFGIEP